MAAGDASCELQKPRKVVKKLLARPQHEGVGAVVRRSIGRFELRYFDPFLVLDEFSVTAPAGFPDHPHRGFETVTYMLQRHDKGRRPAVDDRREGIVHSEMPAAQGTQKGLQLWVNLSSQNKIGHRHRQARRVEVRVIAGESMGIKSPIRTKTPAMYLDFTLKPSAHIRQPVPPGWNSFIYVLEGEGVFGRENSTPGGPTTSSFSATGTAWRRGTSLQSPRFVVVAGEPLGEPVAQLGPFVMNTEEEIDRTVEDYQRYVNGFEKARYWTSKAMATEDF
ncbi:unnamed protein product [Spirodela intermedia]|uniref:Uncharacterized protein n=1 Tax=Spirodela intermedia TaxID=51605 RepID=A0A7I8JN00_SPIIN|nr:unnamed protein product [Spirodela intermedia]CAA6670842.1 unnamed protein product [Spirodela intermedia]